MADGAAGVGGAAAPGTLEASDGNQGNLEARANALYEKIMNKNISFQENTAPTKADKDNSGKIQA